MRYLLLALVSAGLALGLALGPARAAAPPTPTAANVPVTTSDGEKLIVSLYGSKSPKGLVLLHGQGGRKEDWATLALRLARSGAQVASVDLRGHGLSTAAADPAKMPEDVRAVLALLYGRGVKKVGLVGAELGANLALGAADDDPAVSAVVLLSPGLDGGGVLATAALARYNPRPLLLVASKDDAAGARAARTLDGLASGIHTLQLYEDAGAGTRMLGLAPDLESRVYGFLNVHVLSAP